MIKRIIACLTICLIITGIVSPVFSDASALPQPNWTDPGISEIINISDLTGWMLNGGTFDVSQYTDSESFMNDYFNARTKTRLISPDEAAEDYYEVLPGFGINNQLVAGESFARPLDTNRVIASSFRDHTGYGRRLSNEVNDALLSSGSLYDTKIPLLNEVEFANFVGYNHDALRLYSEFFNNDNDIIVNPDPNYISLLENINGAGFWWKNYSNYNVDNGSKAGLVYYPCDSVSWFTKPSPTMSMTFSEASTSQRLKDVYTSDILNLNIIYSNNIYSFDLTIPSTDIYWQFNEGFGSRVAKAGNVWSSYQGFTYYYFGDAGPFSFSYSGTLSDVLAYIESRFKNVNIYVDGVCWSYVGTSSTPTITPEFPDAVGGDELPSTTWPISRPRAPYYTSVPGMLQAIEDAIADDGKLDIDDLKPYLTDENGDPVPDPIFDPEPVPIPVPDPVNPDVIPGLPELPVIPLNMPGFNGVSVLAEIINFTNQSLPNSLIVTFWGIIFGIVILGLIKILHK